MCQCRPSASVHSSAKMIWRWESHWSVSKTHHDDTPERVTEPQTMEMRKQVWPLSWQAALHVRKLIPHIYQLLKHNSLHCHILVESKWSTLGNRKQKKNSFHIPASFGWGTGFSKMGNVIWIFGTLFFFFLKTSNWAMLRMLRMHLAW